MSFYSPRSLYKYFFIVSIGTRVNTVHRLATGKPATPSVKGKAKVGNSPQSNQQQSERGSAQMSSRRKPRSSLPSEPTGSSYYHASDKNETHETVDEDVLADLVVSTQQKNNKENHLPAATSAGRLKRPRKFIEKQSGAQRVSQISDDQEQEASDQEILQVEGAEPSSSGSESEIPAKASTPKKAGRGKAGPKEVVKISRADKRRQAPSRTVRAMPQAKMTADPVEEDEDEEQLETQDAATLARARFNARMKAEAASPAPSTPSRLGSLAPIDPSAPTPSYREIQKRAKERSAMLRKAPPQKRRFWVEEEEQELIRLIEERGCAWAEFEKEGAFNRWGGRNQGQLKDKAMNIRFDLEK